MIDFEVTKNGNLRIFMSSEDTQEVAEMLENATHKDRGFLDDLLEHTGWRGNGRLYQLYPEDIGALTDAPVLTDDMAVEDDGKITIHGKVWWYPSYELSSFAEVLIATGEVIFKAAPEN